MKKDSVLSLQNVSYFSFVMSDANYMVSCYNFISQEGSKLRLVKIPHASKQHNQAHLQILSFCKIYV